MKISDDKDAGGLSVFGGRHVSENGKNPYQPLFIKVGKVGSSPYVCKGI